MIASRTSPFSLLTVHWPTTSMKMISSHAFWAYVREDDYASLCCVHTVSFHCVPLAADRPFFSRGKLNFWEFLLFFGVFLYHAGLHNISNLRNTHKHLNTHTASRTMDCSGVRVSTPQCFFGEVGGGVYVCVCVCMLCVWRVV